MMAIAQAHLAHIWRFIESVKTVRNRNEQAQVQLRAGHTEIRQQKSSKYVS